MTSSKDQVDAFIADVSDEELDSLLKLATRLHELGTNANEVFAGKSGWLFWEVSGQLQQLRDQLKYIKETGEYSAFPDEDRTSPSK